VKKILIIVCLLLVHAAAFAQVDTEFWFAPPEVTAGHGDRPIYLRISTLDRAASVQVRQPARNNALLASISIPANTTSTVNLTSQISFIEPLTPAAVQLTGIRITSSAPVTAYYEVGAPLNTDIYSLKGKNALGNRFVIPAQNLYNNSSEYFPTPFFAFDIVAVSNNTVVKVRPTRPLFGHESESEITIRLNAGQTYRLRKTSTAAASNPVGTVVESTKPIAITLTDDSVINGGCRDILGDQLVPVDVAGTEYVVLKGFLFSLEYAFITAIDDNTQLFIDGQTPGVQLQAGELFRVPIINRSTYITANKNIYVLHVTGFGCEMGMALLPSITCKGSEQIGFSRTTSEFFGLNVLVRKEGISGFRLNGSNALVPASAFSPVPGTNDRWYAAQLSFTTTQIPVNAPSLIRNDLFSFQIGIFNGNETSSCRYGYFSSFSTLFIGDDFAICEGETAVLDAGPDKEAYLWSTGSTTQQITIDNPGSYWVRVEKEDCVLYDTISVDIRAGSVNIGPDVSVCEGETAVVDGRDNFSWLWSDGTSERYLRTVIPGKYWVNVFDNIGCEASDTVIITTKPLPVVNLGPDRIKCPAETVFLNVSQPGGSYRWENGTTAPTRTLSQPGLYWCEVTVNGCSARDSIRITNLPGPQQNSIEGTAVVCPAVQGVVYAVEDIPNSQYAWQVQGGIIAQENNNSIQVNWGAATNTAQVQVIVTDSLGCIGNPIVFPVRINTQLEPTGPAGPEVICSGTKDGVQYTTTQTSGSIYSWSVDGGDIVAGQGSARITVNWGLGTNRIRVTETSATPETVCAGISVEKAITVFQDSARLSLSRVSVDTLAEANIRIWIDVQNPSRVLNQEVLLFKRTPDNEIWRLHQLLPASSVEYVDGNNETSLTAYQYYTSLTNLCLEPVQTPIHQTVHLTGDVNTSENTISLRWTPYAGWENGVLQYEVWRKLDQEAGFSFLQAISPDQLTFTTSSLSGFEHQYRIRATKQGDTQGVESWSNRISFSFDHEVFVPNVITPNGDGFNQYLVIRNIELFPQSRLTIFNRWGSKVYEARGYDNSWKGDNLEPGVYFYELALNRNNVVLKGTLSIIR
jgi:gliding motility-associated-like protein